MCRVLKVYRSSYYKYLNKKESKRSIENRYLEGEILDIYKASKGRYGAPKIHEKLKSKDIFISLNGDFTTTAINQKWVTDITYIHTIKNGWCYLASVMDLNSRKIVYSMSKNIDTELALKALYNAYKL